MRPGDVYVLNDPYHGGTHLPDVTVVTPVYLDSGDDGAELLRRLARPPRRHRRHHAGLDAAVLDDDRRGGRAVRQLPAGARRPAARGRAAARCWPAARYPARNPEQNIADLRAQIAANEKGVQELRAMVAQFGRATVAAYMGHVQDNAEESVRRVDHGAEGRRASRCRSTTARTIARQGHASTRRSARRRSTSPAPARSCRTTSTRPRR